MVLKTQTRTRLTLEKSDPLCLGTIIVRIIGMKVLSVILAIHLTCLYLHAQVTFSEIMFDPDTDENHDEYVEILNLSDTGSVDLTGFWFSDGQGVDAIYPLGDHFIIPPGGYALLLDGSYPENSVVYDSIILGNSATYIISDRAFGSNGLSNSKDECLSLISPAGDTIAAYCYTVGNKPGYSDEKILPEGPDTPANWKDAVKYGGTPGRRNSVSPFDLDAGFKEPGVLLPPFLSGNETNHLKVFVASFGLQKLAAGLRLEIAMDDPDIVLVDTLFYLSGNEMVLNIPLHFNGLAAGEYVLRFRIICGEDQNAGNNLLERTIVLYQSENDLAINEIKFLTEEGEPEWIELYNYGAQNIYLRGWMIADSRDTASVDTPIYIEPNQYLVLASDWISRNFSVDTSCILILKDLPSLNNSGDEVILIRPDGSWQERVYYAESWLQEESVLKPSLERINPRLYSESERNWGPCVAPQRGTPGKANSILTIPAAALASVSISPNPFSPDGDGREDFALISGIIPESSARVRIRVFDICGRLIRTIIENRFTGNHFDTVWDGMDDDGRTARIGIYIIFVQVIDDLSGILREMKTTVVLAKPL